MFERFSSTARAVVIAAQEEARRLGHERIGTEHVLLALLAEPSPAAAALGVERSAVEAKVLELREQRREAGPGAPPGDAIGPRRRRHFGRRSGPDAEPAVDGGTDGASGGPKAHIPFTPRCKKVLGLALRESLNLGHREIGTSHIALGLLREGEGLGMQVLAELGVDLGALRPRLLKAAVEEAGPSRRGRGSGPRFRFGRPSGIGESSAGLVSSLRDPASPAAKVLREKGLDPAELADEIAAASEPSLQGIADATTIEVDGDVVVVRVADPALARALATTDQRTLAHRLAEVLADVRRSAA